MEEKNYVLKLDGDYYAGPNPKYWDMFNISGSGALGARKMTEEDALKLRDSFARNGWDASVELYEPKKYMKKALEKILECEQGRRNGKDYGYLVENLTKYCMEYLEQI